MMDNNSKPARPRNYEVRIKLDSISKATAEKLRPENIKRSIKPPPAASGSFRSVGDIARPLAKKIIIHAYCNGWLSKSRTQKLFRDLDLGDC